MPHATIDPTCNPLIEKLVDIILNSNSPDVFEMILRHEMEGVDFGYWLGIMLGRKVSSLASTKYLKTQFEAMTRMKDGEYIRETSMGKFLILPSKEK